VSSIVVLGAADGALSTYRIAREMGYRTIAVDWSPDAPGIALADEYLPVSTRDAAGIVAGLGDRGRDVVGVLAPCSDIAVPTVRELCLALGRPVPLSELAARASLDKCVVRAILDELGVSSYRWLVGDDPVEVAESVAGGPFPVVVKPADSQGGRGVARCREPGEVLAAAVEAKRRSSSGRIMVEEEVLGVHASAECVVDGGRVVFMATTRQTLCPPPASLTLAHQMPAGLPPAVEDTVWSIVDKMCARLDYQRGPLNLDLVVTPDGEPYLIELGLRTGGNGIDDLVRTCYGVDPIRAAVQAAVGEPIELDPHPPRAVRWQVLAADRSGRLRAVTGEAEARAMAEVAELVVLARPGRAVRPYQEVTDRLGWLVLAAATTAELDAAADRVAQTLRLDIESTVDGQHG
jgi:biotin carboxylase